MCQKHSPNHNQSTQPATKSELMAMVHFTRYFRQYPLDKKLKIVTDHIGLRWLHNSRWFEKLANFEYEVQYNTDQVNPSEMPKVCSKNQLNLTN